MSNMSKSCDLPKKKKTHTPNKKTPIFLGQAKRNSLSRPRKNSPLYLELVNLHLEGCDYIGVPHFRRGVDKVELVRGG